MVYKCTAHGTVMYSDIPPTALKDGLMKNRVSSSLISAPWSGQRHHQTIFSLGYNKIPALIIELTDEEMLTTALVENLQRKALNPIEEAKAYELLHSKFGLADVQIASKVAKTRDHVAQRRKLLTFSQELQELVSRDTISTSVAGISMEAETPRQSSRVRLRLYAFTLSQGMWR